MLTLSMLDGSTGSRIATAALKGSVAFSASMSGGDALRRIEHVHLQDAYAPILCLNSIVSFLLSTFGSYSRNIVIAHRHFTMRGFSIPFITAALFLLLAATVEATFLPSLKGLFTKHGPQVNASDVRFTQYQRPGPDDC